MKARVTYAHPGANHGKLAKLAALQAAYRAYVQTCIDRMVVGKRHHIKPAEFQSFFPKSSVLSSQLQKCARMQAVNIVSTWAKALYSQLKRRIYERNYPPAFRAQLRVIGKCLLTRATRAAKMEITEEALAIWWSWVWDIEIAGSSPVVADDLPMWLSEMCVEFGTAQKAAGLGGWWVRVSCLDNGRRLVIPLAATPYLTDPAAVAKSVLIGQHRGRWRFQFTDKTPAEVYVETAEKIGVDVGLNVLAATSNGAIYGQRVKPKFDRLYKAVRRARANRQRQGLKKNSPRLDRLEQRLSGMVKTEVGTIANRLVRQHPEAAFVIENLDLRGCRGQKRFAYRALHHALETKAPVIVVNPAYTSQTCPSCGYVSRLNRRGGAFRCRSCGKISHADVVGAKNLLGRSEDNQVRGHDHYKAVGTTLRARYRLRRDSTARRRGGRPRGVPTVVPVVYCAASAHSDEDGREVAA